MILAWILARWTAFQGLPPLMRRLMAGVAVLALCAIAWALWLHHHDRKVIAEHEAPITEAIAQATERANEAANAADTARQIDNARRDEGLRDAIAEASRAAPTEVARPAGPAVNAVARKLREHRP